MFGEDLSGCCLDNGLLGWAAWESGSRENNQKTDAVVQARDGEHLSQGGSGKSEKRSDQGMLHSKRGLADVLHMGDTEGMRRGLGFGLRRWVIGCLR